MQNQVFLCAVGWSRFQCCQFPGKAFGFGIRDEYDGSSFAMATSDPLGFNAAATADGFVAKCIDWSG